MGALQTIPLPISETTLYITPGLCSMIGESSILLYAHILSSKGLYTFCVGLIKYFCNLAVWRF